MRACRACESQRQANVEKQRPAALHQNGRVPRARPRSPHRRRVLPARVRDVIAVWLQLRGSRGTLAPDGRKVLEGQPVMSWQPRRPTRDSRGRQSATLQVHSSTATPRMLSQAEEYRICTLWCLAGRVIHHRQHDPTATANKPTRLRDVDRGRSLACSSRAAMWDATT